MGPSFASQIQSLSFPLLFYVLGGRNGLSHSLGYLVVCFSQSEGLAGDGHAEKGKGLGGYILLSQAMSPAMTVLCIQLLLGGPSLVSPSCHLSGSGSWLC